MSSRLTARCSEARKPPAAASGHGGRQHKTTLWSEATDPSVVEHTTLVDSRLDPLRDRMPQMPRSRLHIGEEGRSQPFMILATGDLVLTADAFAEIQASVDCLAKVRGTKRLSRRFPLCRGARHMWSCLLTCHVRTTEIADGYHDERCPGLSASPDVSCARTSSPSRGNEVRVRRGPSGLHRTLRAEEAR